jgi:hypothetical protein
MTFSKRECGSLPRRGHFRIADNSEPWGMNPKAVICS